jgi:hypothetical protein
MTNEYLLSLSEAFKSHANPEVAKGQMAYMKNHFEFYGLKTPIRRELQQPFLVKQHLPPKPELEDIIKIL